MDSTDPWSIDLSPPQPPWVPQGLTIVTDCSVLVKVLVNALERNDGGVQQSPHVELTTGPGRDDAIRALARAAVTSSELLVVLRDGTELAPVDMRSALERASFRGRLLCVSGDVAFCGVWDGASFEWAILHQQCFCGTVVLKTLAVVLACHGMSRALSQATIDDAWDAVVKDSSWVSPERNDGVISFCSRERPPAAAILVTSKGW
jgi:hypothetical protein